MPPPSPAGTGVRQAAAWDTLRTRLRGEVVLPADTRYEFARQLQQMEFDSIGPLAIAYCETAGDVQTCIRFAQDRGLPVRVRSGGHSHNGWSTGEALVIDVSRINRVSVGIGTVHIGPGTQSVDALAALKAYDRQIVTGTFPTVAAGGFLSGGGLGWQTRRFGVASDRIVSAQVVLADGRLVRCSATEEPDLYWAVRGGGGGNFGVVVDFEVRPIDAPRLVRYDTSWRLDRAAELIAAWQDWCTNGPEELGSSLVVLPKFGPDGAPSVRVWGVHLRCRKEVEAALADLADRAGTNPSTVEIEDPQPYADAMHRGLCGPVTVTECHRTGSSPEAKGHRHPRTLRTYRLTGRAMAADEAGAAIEAWDPALDQERYLLFIAVGGAANRVGRTETAYVHRGAQFLAGYQYAMRRPAPDAERLAAAWAWTDRTAATLEPVACGSYVNFPSTRPEPQWQTAFYGENYPRLAEVKRRYDPAGFFCHQQSIGT
jgi:FAD binding domain/Berberine and berberine like